MLATVETVDEGSICQNRQYNIFRSSNW